MCGVLALLLADTNEFCRQSLFDGLTILQHRGQDAAGIATSNTKHHKTRLNRCKSSGMVRDVFGLDEMLQLEGNAGIGHCRYPTAGSSNTDEAQPMFNNYPCGLALAHNGNLTNTFEIQEHVRGLHRHLNTQSDSEALLNVIAEELRRQLDERAGLRTAPLGPDVIFAAIKNSMEIIRGGYAVVMLVHDVGIVAFRDPNGIRPLVVGKRSSATLEGGIDYAFSSESVAIDGLGFDLLRDVKPGECILALPMKPGHPRPDQGLLSRQLVGDGRTKLTPCLFEYVYFARPDSVMNGVSVHESRLVMGDKLGERILKLHPEHDIDVVIPIPDTSRTCALSLSQKLGVPYREGFIKNRYIGRTFIMPEQTIRKKNVRLKLNTVKSEFHGKNVLLCDDSIVRGTTSTEIVEMARHAGANKVYFCSAAPEIRYPNTYGIDLPTPNELVAYNKNTEEIAKAIGCDWIVYQDLHDLEESVSCLNPEIKEFENCTFSGKYITGDVDEHYFDELARVRSNDAKLERDNSLKSSNGITVPPKSPKNKKKS